MLSYLDKMMSDLIEKCLNDYKQNNQYYFKKIKN